jgi:transcriptional regulator with PAS, ATPase and Fis domain
VEILRVIESRKFNRVGGNEIVESDFRIITATNEDLEKLIEEGKFRKDLYYRLNVITLPIPPLRERREDIPILAEHFLKKYCEMMGRNVKGISAEAMDFMMNYQWLGNVRELENAIERAVVIGKTDLIKAEDLPFNKSNTNADISPEGDLSLSAIEKKYIEKVLEQNNWNISRSANLLKIDRVTLYNKMSKFGLRKPS